jgi:hypothetical protein
MTQTQTQNPNPNLNRNQKQKKKKVRLKLVTLVVGNLDRNRQMMDGHLESQTGHSPRLMN